MRAHGDWGWPERPGSAKGAASVAPKPDWDLWRETRTEVLAVGVGVVLLVSGMLYGHSEATRTYTEQGRLLPGCAVGRHVAEDEIQFDFVGGKGAVVRCIIP